MCWLLPGLWLSGANWVNLARLSGFSRRSPEPGEYPNPIVYSPLIYPRKIAVANLATLFRLLVWLDIKLTLPLPGSLATDIRHQSVGSSSLAGCTDPCKYLAQAFRRLEFLRSGIRCVSWDSWPKKSI